MRYLILISFVFISTLSLGQYQELFNQSIEVKNVNTVDVNLNGNVTFQEWEGTFLLVETKVVIENCNENIFRSFVQEGRYIVKHSFSGQTVSLDSHKNLGRMVKSRLGETKETVYFKIYFPDGFKDSAGNLLTSTITHEQVEEEKEGLH